MVQREVKKNNNFWIGYWKDSLIRDMGVETFGLLIVLPTPL